MATRNRKNKGNGNGRTLEATLWAAADKLRGHMDAAEYKHVVLGLIFLKYISDAFEEHQNKLKEDIANPESELYLDNPEEREAALEDRDEYIAANIFWVPQEARWSHLRANAKQPTIGKTLDDAMVAIERDNPSLKGVLPKDYARPALGTQLGELIDLIGTIELGDKANRSQDILGRAYEYFLDKFRTEPATEIASVDIAHADPVFLRELNSVYDIWALLADRGRKLFIRGKVTDWDSHERPLVESYRWQVKARVARKFSKKIRFFELAGSAADAGKTEHCRNQARAMQAHALRCKADQALRSKRPFLEIADLYREAREAARGFDLEPLLGFRENACILRHSEVSLQFDEALQAHAAALDFARKLPDPDSLFERPNPWTSLKDFENERLFILVLRTLHTDKMSKVDNAIAAMQKIINACGESVRRIALNERLLVLEALQAMVLGRTPVIEDRVDKLSRLLQRPHVPRHSIELLDLLNTGRFGANPENLLPLVVPLFPLDAIGAGRGSVAPLLYGAPKWLQRLIETREPQAAHLFLLWYVRLVLDWAWSVYEKDCGKTGITARERPPIRQASLRKLSQYASDLLPVLKWIGEPSARFKTFTDELLWLGSSDEIKNEDAHLFVRATESVLLPLVVGVRRQLSGDFFLERMDGLGKGYSYAAKDIDRRASQFSGTRAYVKPRYRLRYSSRGIAKTDPYTCMQRLVAHSFRAPV